MQHRGLLNVVALRRQTARRANDCGKAVLVHGRAQRPRFVLRDHHQRRWAKFVHVAYDRDTLEHPVAVEKSMVEDGYASGFLRAKLPVQVHPFADHRQSLSQASTRDSTAGRRSRLGIGLLSRLGRALCWALGTLTDALLDTLTFRSRGRKRSGSIGNAIVFVLLGGFLVLPTVFLIPVSFTQSSFLGWPPDGLTLKWYREYFDSAVWLAATGRSLLVAAASGALAMLLGVTAAFALSSERTPGRTGWLMFVLSPFFVPRIIVAVALFYLFAKLRLLDSTLGLILGHAVLGVPYVVITVMAILNTYDHQLNQAAWTLGASRWQALRRITLPIIKPGLFSAYLFAFVTSFDDVTLALFLSAGKNTTLPKQMWADATMQVSPLLAAVSTIVLVVVTVLILVAETMRAKADRLIAQSSALS